MVFKPSLLMFHQKKGGTYPDGLQVEPTDIFVSCMSERTASIGQYFLVSANQKAENKR
jgi:hypothetical protein